MSLFRTRFWIGLPLLVCACATLTKARQDNLVKVHLGQSEDQVIEALGSPTRKISKGNVELWYYDIFSSDSSHMYPYTARFEDRLLTNLDFDTLRNADDAKLRRQRATANQELWEYNGTNGSPALQGTDPRDHNSIEILKDPMATPGHP